MKPSPAGITVGKSASIPSDGASTAKDRRAEGPQDGAAGATTTDDHIAQCPVSVHR